MDKITNFVYNIPNPIILMMTDAFKIKITRVPGTTSLFIDIDPLKLVLYLALLRLFKQLYKEQLNSM